MKNAPCRHTCPCRAASDVAGLLLELVVQLKAVCHCLCHVKGGVRVAGSKPSDVVCETDMHVLQFTC